MARSKHSLLLKYYSMCVYVNMMQVMKTEREANEFNSDSINQFNAGKTSSAAENNIAYELLAVNMQKK